MKSKKILRVVSLLLVAAIVQCGCGSNKTDTKGTTDEKKDSSQSEKSDNLNSLSLEELEKKAKEEGTFETVGMPDDWANWAGSWSAIKDKYGLDHYDTDMTSAEELSLFEAEKDSPTKDFGDVGHAFSKQAIEKDLLQGYKPSTWDSIPDWAKDPDGKWILSYTGTIAFGINTKSTNGEVPKSWAELKNSNCQVTVGNVLAGASSQVAVVSCALANGGSLDNVQPGIDYFKELAEAGRLDPGDITYARIAGGEIQACVGQYDYSMLADKDQLKSSNTDIPFEVNIPSDGAVTSGYCLVFNKYAPHKYAAALAIEYLLSDEGQIDRARGYARPVRSVELPQDVQEKMLPDSEYSNTTTITDVEQLSAACEKVAKLWEEQIIPIMNK